MPLTTGPECRPTLLQDQRACRQSARCDDVQDQACKRNSGQRGVPGNGTERIRARLPGCLKVSRRKVPRCRIGVRKAATSSYSVPPRQAGAPELHGAVGLGHQHSRGLQQQGPSKADGLQGAHACLFVIAHVERPATLGGWLDQATGRHIAIANGLHLWCRAGSGASVEMLMTFKACSLCCPQAVMAAGSQAHAPPCSSSRCPRAHQTLSTCDHRQQRAHASLSTCLTKQVLSGCTQCKEHDHLGTQPAAGSAFDQTISLQE